MNYLDNIALFDLDGTLADYDSAIQKDLALIASPNDPTYISWGDNPDYLEKRIKLIRQRPGWWRNLGKFQLGFDVLEIAREFGYEIEILTKGPRSATSSWTEKAEWAMDNVPDADVTITEKKGRHYGKVLVDDYPGYIEGWLQQRPRGLVIMPAHSYNEEFSHQRIVRYDGSNIDQVRRAMMIARDRKSGEPLRLA